MVVSCGQVADGLKKNIYLDKTLIISAVLLQSPQN